jgi:CBS domain-containing protein
MDTVRSVMTGPVVTLPPDATVAAAAEQMRANDIGNVLVAEGRKLFGVVTDRDLVVKAMALGLDPQRTPLERVCTQETVTIGPDADVAEAAKLMADNALRRLPVMVDDQIVGILSLGDLAAKRGPDTTMGETLGEISAAPPNN